MKFQVGDRVRLIKSPEELQISYYDAKALAEEVLQRRLIGTISGIWDEKSYRVTFPSGLLLLPEEALEKIEEASAEKPENPPPES